MQAYSSISSFCRHRFQPLSSAAHRSTTRAPRAALVMLILVCTSLCLEMLAYAGPGRQGTRPRGPRREPPGGAMRVHGRQFVGFKLDIDESRFTMIRVLRFLGDRVDARVWKGDAGWVREDMHARDLVGVEWAENHCDDHGECTTRKFRITGAAPGRSERALPAHGHDSDIWLYDVDTTAAADPGPRDWRPACGKDPRGTRQGRFLTGEPRRDGSRSSSGYTFACTAD